jgi:hypothetical protein
MKGGQIVYTCSFHIVEDKGIGNVASKPERRNKAFYAGG